MSSTATVESMAAIIVTPAAAAARAVARSASGWARRWKAVGASSTGIAMPVPSTVTSRVGGAAPRRTRGTSMSLR
jgi:hypothetical protein